MRNLLLILVFTLSCYTFLQAQSSEPQGRRWWTGAHTAIGFGASTQFINYTLGLAPMFGYQVIPGISVGPRASILYNHIRLRDIGGNVIQTYNVVDTGIGAFVRGQVYQQYFLQAELMYESIDNIDLSGSAGRLNGMNAYIGAGMNSRGRTPSFEIMLAYDLNLQAIFKNNLLNFRFGFTLFY